MICLWNTYVRDAMTILAYASVDSGSALSAIYAIQSAKQIDVKRVMTSLAMAASRRRQTAHRCRGQVEEYGIRSPHLNPNLIVFKNRFGER